MPTDPAAKSSGSGSKTKGYAKQKSLQAVKETGPTQEGSAEQTPKAISSPKQGKTPELSPKSKEGSQTGSKTGAAQTKPKDLQATGQSEVVVADANSAQTARAPKKYHFGESSSSGRLLSSPGSLNSLKNLEEVKG